MFQRITAITFVCFFIAIIASCQVQAACGPPMCNDNVLFAPAMVKLLYNHMNGNTSLPTKGSLPCTACLPCCSFLASVQQSTIEQRHEIQALNTIVDSVDWTCKMNECPTHHMELRNLVSKVVEEKSQPLLKSIPLNSESNGDISQSIRDHLQMYSAQIKRSRDFEKTRNGDAFLKNLLGCPCTACPQECAVRKLLFKMY